jgi:hypothetical protein
MSKHIYESEYTIECHTCDTKHSSIPSSARQIGIFIMDFHLGHNITLTKQQGKEIK